jgi:CHAD domain-containing protein
MKRVTQSPIAHALAYLAMEEGQSIDRALAGARNRHKGIHEARKAIRRVRALLSFGRKAFGAQGKRLDRKLQALGRGLSRLRDAQVSVATAHTLQRRAALEYKPQWQALAHALAGRRVQLLDAALAADPAFRHRRKRVASMRKALGSLPWDALDEKTIAGELDKSRRRVARAEHRATQDRTPTVVHRWRRRVRRLRLQLTALETVRESGVRIRGVTLKRSAIRQQTRLAEALGWKQDLQVLRSIVRRTADMPNRKDMLDQMRAQIRHAQ